MIKHLKHSLRHLQNARTALKKSSSTQKGLLSTAYCHFFQSTQIRTFCMFSTNKTNQNLTSTEQSSSVNINLKKNALRRKDQVVELLKKQNYSFRILTNRYKTQAVDLIARQFRAHQPLMNAYLRKYPQCEKHQEVVVRQLWETWMEHSCLNNMSVAIHDTHSKDELIGVFAVKDYLFEPVDLTEKHITGRSLNMFGSVLQLFNFLVQSADPLVMASLRKPHTVADLWGAAISNRHLGKNLLSEMMKLNEQLAKKEGYSHTFCFASNFKTQKGLRRLNYEMLSKINAKSAVCFESHPFELIEQEQKYPSIWFKRLP